MIPIKDRLPTRTIPYVNYLLIAANVVAFFFERATILSGYPAARFVFDWGLVPARFLHAPAEEAVTVFTSMFLHDPSSWLHIGGNMLFLWIFGDNVEDAVGHGRYLFFYLLSGVAAAATQMAIGPSSGVPMIGASGAIAGVLAAYMFLYPRAPVTILNPVPPLWLFFGLFFDLPAWIVIAEFFVVNLLNGLGSLGSHIAGVAFFAHVGGFLAGLAMVRFFMIGRTKRATEKWTTWRTPPRAPRRRPDLYGYGPPSRPRDPWGW